jgi:hypothetical protein
MPDAMRGLPTLLVAVGLLMSAAFSAVSGDSSSLLHVAFSGGLAATGFVSFGFWLGRLSPQSGESGDDTSQTL